MPPKAYWIGRIDVTDPEGYTSYLETARPAFERFGGKFLVRGGKAEALDGAARERNVVIEFASMQDARDCFHSPEYTAARAFRLRSSQGEIVLVEGAV